MKLRGIREVSRVVARRRVVVVEVDMLRNSERARRRENLVSKLRSLCGLQERVIIGSGVLKVREQVKRKMDHRLVHRSSRSSSAVTHHLRILILGLPLLLYHPINQYPTPVSDRNGEEMLDTFCAVFLVVAVWEALLTCMGVKNAMHTARWKLLVRNLLEAEHSPEAVGIPRQRSSRSGKTALRIAEAIVDVLE